MELLHLVGCQDAGELGLGVVADGEELLATLVLCEAGVGAEGGYLLLVVGEDGLELRGLVGGEAEALADVHCGLVRIEVVTMMTGVSGGLLRRGLTGWCRWLLAEGRRDGEGEG
jgi:hypothetical protein